MQLSQIHRAVKGYFDVWGTLFSLKSLTSSCCYLLMTSLMWSCSLSLALLFGWWQQKNRQAYAHLSLFCAFFQWDPQGTCLGPQLCIACQINAVFAAEMGAEWSSSQKRPSQCVRFANSDGFFLIFFFFLQLIIALSLKMVFFEDY